MKQEWAPRSISIGNFSQIVRCRESRDWKGCVRVVMLYIGNEEITPLMLPMFIYIPHSCQPLFPALAWNSPFLKIIPFGTIFNTRLISAAFLLHVNQAFLFLRKELYCSNDVSRVISAVWITDIWLTWVKAACVMIWEEANAFVFSNKKVSYL